jgi:hypothetical protein
MLPNTVTFREGGNSKTVLLIDGPTNQRTVRSSADSLVRLTIAHQESNENPGFVTQRSNVRINLSKEVEDTGKSVNGYVQLTQSFPKDVMTVAEISTLFAYMLNLVVDGGETLDPASGIAKEDLDLVPRLSIGEP